MMLRLLYVVPLLFVATSCVSQQVATTASQKVEPLTPYELSAQELALIEDTIRDALKDPESARFDNLVAGISKDRIVVVCGWLNAKNSYGGYTGKKPFTGTVVGNGPAAAFVPFNMEGDERQQKATIEKCRQNGLRI